MIAKHRKIAPFSIYILLPALSLIYLACGGKGRPDPEKVVVAQVGGEKITVGDFRFNYEFGFAHLKTGPDRKSAYLEKMIDEKVFALRGYEMGLQQSEWVQERVRDLQDELIIEEVFRDRVQAGVKISDQEIKEAIDKSKASWKLRYWYEPNQEFAESVRIHMRRHGYAATVEEILANNPEVTLKPGDFETPYITYLDVSPELLDAIQDLQAGEISEVVQLDDGYYIFQIVNIRRGAVTEFDYKDRRETFRKILRARKEQELADQFIAEFMTPKNVVTRGQVFVSLSKNLYEWFKNREKHETLPGAMAEAGDDRPYLSDIRAQSGETLVTFAGGSWTVADFLQQFRPRTIDWQEADDLITFQNKLNRQIALTVRDHFLLQKGYKDKVHRRPGVKAELGRWTDKWVYQELRRQLSADLTVDGDEVRQYFDRFRDRFKAHAGDVPRFEDHKDLAISYTLKQKQLSLLQTESQKLKDRYGVTIAAAVLDTITTIEFEKSRWASLQLYKRSSHRLAFPVVDPDWGF